MTTVQEKYVDTTYADEIFGDRKAKDIYLGMQFRAAGRHYEVVNVFIYRQRQAAINVGWVHFPGQGDAPAWFFSCKGIEWYPDSKGEGMNVATEDGRKGVIKCIMLNRYCQVFFPDGSYEMIHESALVEK